MKRVFVFAALLSCAPTPARREPIPAAQCTTDAAPVDVTQDLAVSLPDVAAPNPDATADMARDVGVDAQVPTDGAGGTPVILWHDSIQTAASPWGFSGLAVEYPIGRSVTGGDSAGASLTRVLDPAGGGAYAIRHFGTFDDGGARAQAGIWSFANPAFDRQAKAPEGIWLAQEWYFPSAVGAKGDEWPWLNLWDWHSTNKDGSARWHTCPGVSLAEDGSMRVKFEWGCPPEDLDTLSSRPMPVGRWFDVEMHYTWSEGPTTVTLWFDGVKVLEQAGVVTKRAGHATVETYMKWYGSKNTRTPWSPTPSIKYTRNVRFAGQRIWR